MSSTNQILRKGSEARHFLAISVLALVMAAFASAASRPATCFRPRLWGDPVIGRMTWETQRSAAMYGSNDPQNCENPCIGLCGNNYPDMCPANCGGSCPITNCPPGLCNW